ncbi:MAG: hypothetical protein SGILL_009368 [Bacillariaceae sp.]
MSSVNGAGFSQQQNLANKKHTDLTDGEKISLLKQEIDNLRGQINEKEHDHYGWKTTSSSEAVYTSSSTSTSAPYQSSTASLSSHGFCASGACLRMPLLTLLLIGAVLWVATKARRSNSSTTSSRQSRQGMGMGSSSMWNSLRSFKPLATMESASDALQFELQEQAISSSSMIDPPSISITSREEDAEKSNATPYQAPDASHVQFV